MAKDTDEVVLTYTPANPGDYIAGVPARDLTERDVRRIEPGQLHAMTVPGAAGTAMYTYTKKRLARNQERAGKEATDTAATDAGKE